MTPERNLCSIINITHNDYYPQNYTTFWKCSIFAVVCMFRCRKQ